jgi:hypothetical protein
MQKSIEDLHLDLVVARADYLDNQGADNADEFYQTYFRAYNAYWKEVDPSKMKDKWN